MLNDPSQIETKELSICGICQAEPRECDKFCRRCGTMLGEAGGTQSGSAASSAHATSSLSQDLYHRVSGRLVAAAVSGISNHTATLQNHHSKLLISALLAIPIWLIIMLLSPLDAYATARTISKQI